MKSDRRRGTGLRWRTRALYGDTFSSGKKGDAESRLRGESFAERVRKG